MAGLEVVVRPLIFPDIRPRPRPALPPEDDPTKGFAVIQGNPAMGTSNSQSWSISSSHARPVETERRVDETRVYQQEDDGTVNQDNFVDLEVANKITMAEPKGQETTGGGGFKGFNGDDTVATVPGRGFTGDDLKQHFYAPVKETANVKIRKKNKIVKNKQE